MESRNRGKEGEVGKRRWRCRELKKSINLLEKHSRKIKFHHRFVKKKIEGRKKRTANANAEVVARLFAVAGGLALTRH